MELKQITKKAEKKTLSKIPKNLSNAVFISWKIKFRAKYLRGTKEGISNWQIEKLTKNTGKP